MKGPFVFAATRRLLARGGPRPRPSPLLVALVAALGWALFVAVVTRTRYGSDVRALLLIKVQTQLPPGFATVPTVGPSGYDGAMYAALATDPLLRRLDTPHYLDAPSYRATRILVPLLAWVLAFGHAPAAIVFYQLLCWGLAIGAVYVLAGWLADEDRSPWWALLAAAGAGMVAVVLRSTPDAAALFFMLAALWLHARGRWPLALGFAVLAVLTRETSVLAALAIAAAELRRRRFVAAAAFTALPAAAMLGWQLYLRHILGAAFDMAGGAFSWPFAWLGQKLAMVAQRGVWSAETYGAAAVAATALAFVVVVSRPATWRAAELAFLAFAGMGLFLGWAVYCETWAYGRALIAVPFLAVLIAERQAVAWRRWTLRSVVLLYALAGVTMARTEWDNALGPRSLAAALVQGTPAGLPLVGTVARAKDAGQVLAPQAPLWVLPAASLRGRADAVWRTRLAVENLHARPVRVAIELFGTGAPGGTVPRTVVTVPPRGRTEWDDTLGELFGRSGAGALRLIADRWQIKVWSVTSDVTSQTPAGVLQPALPEGRAVHAGEQVSFAGLAHDPVHAAGVRTNIGVLNLASTPVAVRVEAFDGGSHRLGEIACELGPGSVTQIDDLFARVRGPRLEDGRAVVFSTTPGAALLVYASVIRGRSAQATYIYPWPEARRAR